MNSGLDENKAELGVLVLTVALEVLADGDGLEVIMSAHFRTTCRGFKQIKRGSILSIPS